MISHIPCIFQPQANLPAPLHRSRTPCVNFLWSKLCVELELYWTALNVLNCSTYITEYFGWTGDFLSCTCFCCFSFSFVFTYLDSTEWSGSYRNRNDFLCCGLNSNIPLLCVLPTFVFLSVYDTEIRCELNYIAITISNPLAPKM